MTDQNIGLRVGAACNQAADVLSGSWRLLSDGTLTHEQLIEIHRELAEGFAKNADTIQAAYGIATAFPGTTAVPQEQFQQAAPAAPQGGFTPANQGAPGNVTQGPWGQQAPQQQAPQGQNFQAAPGTGGGIDGDWQKLFANPKDFWDNRQSKTNPKGPDFREKNGQTALWLNSSKTGPAPQWVFDRLQGGFGPVQ